MNRDDHEATPAYRSIWEFDCLSQTVLLAAAFTPEDRSAILQDCLCDCLRIHLNNPGWVLLALHRACRHSNKISLRIERLLNERYNGDLDANDISVNTLMNMNPSRTSRDALPGCLWTLLRHTDEDRHEIAQFLVHDWLCRAAQEPPDVPRHSCGSSAECCGKHHTDAPSAEALARRISEQDQIIDHMLAYIQRTRPCQSSEAMDLVASNHP